MKRLIIYNVFNAITSILFITVLVFELNNPLLNINPENFWFPWFVFCVGLSLFIKTIIYKTDSSLWFALVFMLIGIIMFISMVLNLTFAQMWPAITAIPATSSLVLTLFFKDWMHLKIFLFLTIISLVFYLFSFKIITVVWFIPIFILSFLIALIFSVILPEKFYNKKKEK